jgi:NAD(P)-dependent dehydrogenase (short-subunit alcohol dehydrogenase family)
MSVLDGKVAIITGSARGIGRATAELLSEHGAKVLINDLDADVAEQTASEIPGETIVFGGDLTKPGIPTGAQRCPHRGGGRCLLPLLAMVQLCSRPGAERHRRPTGRDDLVARR